MNITLNYLFDPLCGWCYGISPAFSALANASEQVHIKLLPTGLFSGAGSRAMNEEFAAFAWSNDQRIASLTGQPFSEQYRHSVLADHQQRFDSSLPTIVLTAVALTQPEKELEMLKAIQKLRYVEGRNVTDRATLEQALHTLGLSDAVALLDSPELHKANQQRLEQAQNLMQEFAARGVPSLIAESKGRRVQLSTADFYADSQALLRQLKAL
ncbi:DsbA family protein [Agarivorans sp. QJM3NY_29]|uniref:DsbA family protein n=1 Tax=unclassified Agarivorans TaxID=2636026 RepID=UPI003D7DE4A4